MYGNLTKHKILTCFLELNPNDSTSIVGALKYEAVRNKFLSKNPKKEKVFGRYISNLAMESYITIENNKNDGQVLAIIENLGIAAVSGEYFIKENRKIIFDSIRDIALILCNIGIAWAAIYALTNKEKVVVDVQYDKPAIQSQLNSLQLQYNKVLLKVDSIDNVHHTSN